MTTARIPVLRGAGRLRARLALGLAAAVAVLIASVDSTQNAVANGDTRTLYIYHEHTKESAAITFRRNGTYDPEALKQLNWLLRDWRLDEAIRMEPRLFDIVWQVYREVGAQGPIHVVSAYRSPQTNAMLRRRSRAVAEHSQHMLGHAMDFYLPDVPMARVREVGMRLQAGGVGFYPNAFNPFVHLDAGSVRSWPRMPRPQLARLFPDGRTVHIPRDGKPMAGYEEAKAEILARGGTVAGYATYAEAGEESAGTRKSLWAMLFGGSDDEDTDFYAAQASQGSRGTSPGTRVAAYAPAGSSDDGGMRSFFGGRSAASPAPADGAPPPGLESYARPASAEPAAAAPPSVPLPPRRPSDVASFFPTEAAPSVRPALPVPAAALAVPVPAPASAPTRGEMRLADARPAAAAPALVDDRTALRALFLAAATPTGSVRHASVPTSRARPQPVSPDVALLDRGPGLRSAFSSAQLEGVPPGAFAGSAVAPLTVLR